MDLQKLVSVLLVGIFILVPNMGTKICDNGMAYSFLRTLTHGTTSHLLFNLGSFSNISEVLTALMGRTTYALVLGLIWMLDVIADYLLGQNGLKGCSIGFSGVVFGLVTFLYFLNQNSLKTVIYNVFLLMAPGFFSPRISNRGHLIGAINGAIVYYLMKFTMF